MRFIKKKWEREKVCGKNAMSFLQHKTENCSHDNELNWMLSPNNSLGWFQVHINRNRKRNRNQSRCWMWTLFILSLVWCRQSCRRRRRRRLCCYCCCYYWRSVFSLVVVFGYEHLKKNARMYCHYHQLLLVYVLCKVKTHFDITLLH